VENGYLDSVKKIIARVHHEDKAGISRHQEPLEKIAIGKVDRWTADNAKKVGVNIEGYEHEISNYFIRHVLKNHGNEKTETKRGNLPITGEDFEKIPDIIEHPDYAIFGAKRNNGERIIYIKKAKNGTILYFEEILTGKVNKSLRGNTLYKTKKTLDKDGMIANIRINGKTDLSKIIIASMDGN
jgi:hypothetical protein